MGASPGNADDGPYPGLPAAEVGGDYGANTNWSGTAQGGISQVKRADQWARMPIETVALNVRVRFERATEPGGPTSFHTRNLTYLVSPPGATHNYGISQEFVVRSAGFGTIPTEATVQIEQRRGPDGFPTPLIVEAIDETHRDGPHPDHNIEHFYSDVNVDDAMTVRIVRLVVDGVPLDIGPDCHTVKPGRLTMLGRGGWEYDPDLNRQQPWLSGHYLAGIGGILSGDLDVPAFTGCVTGNGEDLSPLITGTISGKDAPLTLAVSGLHVCITTLPDGKSGPPAPGMSTPTSVPCTESRIVPMPEFPVHPDAHTDAHRHR